MRNNLLISLLALGSLCVLTGVQAFGMDTTGLQVNVPFSFRVEKTVLPAGRYLITPVDISTPNLLVIRNEDGGPALAVLTEPLSPRLNAPEKSELVFTRVGNLDYLTQIWDSDTNEGNGIPEKALTGQSNGSQAPQQHSIPAHKS